MGTAELNVIQRRLFRAFLAAGGDIMEEQELERFVRYVEMMLSMLPSKIRAAVDLAWRARDPVSYERLASSLSTSEGAKVSPAALRQRVSRGLRMIEVAVGERHWACGDHRPRVR